MMANYVYEHVADNTQNVVDYKGILPEGRVFTWKEIGKFPPSKNILMHSVIYRTEILRAAAWSCPSTPSMLTTSLSTSRCRRSKPSTT